MAASAPISLKEALLVSGNAQKEAVASQAAVLNIHFARSVVLHCFLKLIFAVLALLIALERLKGVRICGLG